MIRDMSKTLPRRDGSKGQAALITAGRVFNAMGSLLAFAGPSRSYRPAIAAEIDAAAWAQTGAAIRGAMREARRDGSRRR